MLTIDTPQVIYTDTCGERPSAGETAWQFTHSIGIVQLFEKPDAQCLFLFGFLLFYSLLKIAVPPFCSR
jgi:hypothetical protein